MTNIENQSLLRSLSVNDKDKLIWSGSFSSLQQFIDDVLGLSWVYLKEQLLHGRGAR